MKIIKYFFIGAAAALADISLFFIFTKLLDIGVELIINFCLRLSDI